MKPIELRVVRLERERVGNRAAQSYVVRVPPEVMDDDGAVRAAIEEHRRRTGWVGWIVLAPARMTQGGWLARYGQAWWCEAMPPQYGWRCCCCCPAPRPAAELLIVATDGAPDPLHLHGDGHGQAA